MGVEVEVEAVASMDFTYQVVNKRINQKKKPLRNAKELNMHKLLLLKLQGGRNYPKETPAQC